MTGPLLWLIYLLTYSDTEHALLGSRRCFRMRSNFDRKFVRYGAKKLLKKVPKKVEDCRNWTNCWKSCCFFML